VRRFWQRGRRRSPESRQGDVPPIAPGSGESAPPGRATTRRGGDVARTAGRMVLWAALGLIFLRGLGAVAASPHKPTAPTTPGATAARGVSGDAQAFAVRFAREYLTWRPGDTARHDRAVGSFFSSDVRDRAATGLPRRGPGQMVAQATVARSTDLGSGRALVTVASQLASGRTVYLTVPVARDRRGGLDLFALPALTAPPPAGSASAMAPDPLIGPDAGQIRALVQRFLAAYVSGEDPSGLAYLVAPGTVIAAMPTGLALGSVDQVGQLDPRGSQMTVEADVRVRDKATRASYPLAYRLQLRHTDRWYVTGVEGGPQA